MEIDAGRVLRKAAEKAWKRAKGTKLPRNLRPTLDMIAAWRMQEGEKPLTRKAIARRVLDSSAERLAEVGMILAERDWEVEGESDPPARVPLARFDNRVSRVVRDRVGRIAPMRVYHRESGAISPLATVHGDLIHAMECEEREQGVKRRHGPPLAFLIFEHISAQVPRSMRGVDELNFRVDLDDLMEVILGEDPAIDRDRKWPRFIKALLVLDRTMWASVDDGWLRLGVLRRFPGHPGAEDQTVWVTLYPIPETSYAPLVEVTSLQRLSSRPSLDIKVHFAIIAHCDKSACRGGFLRRNDDPEKQAWLSQVNAPLKLSTMVAECDRDFANAHDRWEVREAIKRLEAEGAWEVEVVKRKKLEWWYRFWRPRACA